MATGWVEGLLDGGGEEGEDGGEDVLLGGEVSCRVDLAVGEGGGGGKGGVVVVVVGEGGVVVCEGFVEMAEGGGGVVGGGVGGWKTGLGGGLFSCVGEGGGEEVD